MAKQVLVVLSNAVEGTDDEFNRWYTGTHLGEVLKLDGYVAAQRFKLSDGQLGPGDVPYRYFALYEVDTEDPADPARALSASTLIRVRLFSSKSSVRTIPASQAPDASGRGLRKVRRLARRPWRSRKSTRLTYRLSLRRKIRRTP